MRILIISVSRGAKREADQYSIALSRDHGIANGSWSLEYADAANIAHIRQPQVLVAYVGAGDSSEDIDALMQFVTKLKRLWPQSECFLERILGVAADKTVRDRFVNDGLALFTASPAELVRTAVTMVRSGSARVSTAAAATMTAPAVAAATA